MEAFLVSTGVVALAEIGDKTQLLAFLLAARFKKPLPIILGIFVATLANQFARGGLEATEARGWMLALLAASLIAKSVIAWVSGGTAYGWRVSAGLMAALAAGAAMVVVF